MEVHKTLGPGLLESSYENCLARELSLNGISCKQQVALPLNYKGMEVFNGYRIDMIVEDKIILELKTVEKLEQIHLAQTLTYLKLSNLTLGFLMNFNVPVMKNGIRRVVLNDSELI